MSKIIKKQTIDTLIENTLKEIGIIKENIIESTVEVIKEEKEETSLINENVKKEIELFNKLSNYTFKK
jgi:stress response protein YsnF